MQDHVDQPHASAAGLRIAIVTSRYHDSITLRLRDGAINCFKDAGGDVSDLLTTSSPGAYELTAICREVATSGDFDAIVALGCVITGETTHDQYICQAVSAGLTNITNQTGVPVAFGILTCQTIEQAAARAGGDKGNKGTEAMSASIETACTIRAIRAASHRGQPLTT